MALRRFYIDAKLVQDRPIVVDGDLFHHIKDVCRFTEGSEFELLPGDGTARTVRVDVLGKKSLQVSEVSRRQLPPLLGPRIHLALSIPKFPKVDWIVEKCVELGVHEIVPFVSEYSFIRDKKDLPSGKVQRWHKLIQAATQQTGRGELMGFASVQSLQELLRDFNRNSSAVGLFPYEGKANKGLPAAVSDLKAKLKQKPFEDLWVFVGSEGGFSQGEVQLFSQAGLEPISMGEQILRVETACLALVSVLKYEFGGQYGSI